MKPSEYLLSKGWEKSKPEAHPQATDWIDPVSGKPFCFIDAIGTQAHRDEKIREPKTKVVS